MKPKKYVLLNDRFDNKAGTIVFKTRRNDFGCAVDDSRIEGVEHMSVTLNEDGDYPFFTVPVSGLKEIK